MVVGQVRAKFSRNRAPLGPIQLTFDRYPGNFGRLLCRSVHQQGLKSQTLDALMSLPEETKGVGSPKREYPKPSYRLLYNAPPFGHICRDAPAHLWLTSPADNPFLHLFSGPMFDVVLGSMLGSLALDARNDSPAAHKHSVDPGLCRNPPRPHPTCPRPNPHI